MSVAVSSGQWQQTSRTADGLYPTQAPKGRFSGLPTTAGSKPFQLWAQGLFCTERNLAKRLKNNSFYPFTQQQPNGEGDTQLPGDQNPAERRRGAGTGI